MLFPSLSIFLNLACASNSWKSASDCAKLSAGAERDNCWAAHIVEVFSDDVKKGEGIVETEIEDETVRDFIWLMITREYDPSTNKYCKKIQEAVLADRCHTLVVRPHLHRGMLKEKNKGGQPATRPQ